MERDQEAAGGGQRAGSAARNSAALLTPTGVGAIAVVRIVGPGVATFLRDCFSARAVEGRCVHGTLRADDQVIDDPVVVLSGDGHIADINLHGGQWVVQACLDLARAHGFEIVPTLPNPASDPIEHEMLASLPLARTEQAIRLLLDQPRRWKEFRARPAADQTLLIPSILADQSLYWMLNPPKVAIVGEANVGKSTLANQLFGQERSITADLPGTTRDWVGDFANLDGLPIMLIDTPGLRHSSDSIEQSAIARSGEQIAGADLVLVVLDPTRPLPPQREILDRYPKTLAIVNKSDLPAVWEIQSIEAIHTVAVRGEGMEHVRRCIRDRFVTSAIEILPNWWTKRQRDLLMEFQTLSP